jgi:hypothetical protein
MDIARQDIRTHSGIPDGQNSAWMFPPKSWVFAAYHKSIVLPLRLRVSSGTGQ